MVIGGIGTLPGPVIGVLVFYALEQLLADYGTVYLIVLGLIGIAVMSLDILVGFGGLMSLGHAALFGVFEIEGVVVEAGH